MGYTTIPTLQAAKGKKNITRANYALLVLKGLGLKTTPNNIAAMVSWMQAEHGAGDASAQAAFNPLNTTMAASGATNFNHIGVKNYKTLQQGIAATIATLRQSDYTHIRAALTSGMPPANFGAVVAASPWGTGNFQVQSGNGSVHVYGAGQSGGSVDPNAGDTSSNTGIKSNMSIIDVKARIKSWWKGNTKDGSGDCPQKLMQAFVDSRGTMSDADKSKWLRNNNFKAYMLTTDARNRAFLLNNFLAANFKDGWKGDKDMAKAIDDYMRKGDPTAVADSIDNFLGKYLRPQAAIFQANFPGWTAFVHGYKGAKPATVALWITAYKAAVAAATETWNSNMHGVKVDQNFITSALTNGWTGSELLYNLSQTDQWQQGPGAGRGLEFDKMWHDCYGVGATPDSALRKQYASDNTTNIDDFFALHVATRPDFQTAQPGYSDWVSEQSTTGATDVDTTMSKYLAAISGWQEEYKGFLGDPKAVLSPTLLAWALKQPYGTSNTIFDNYIKANDPTYTGSTTGKTQAASFTEYWHSLFGQDSTPDASIQAAYLAGNYSGPKDMFNQIRQTGAFQSQYGNWDAFAAGQLASGGGGTPDPASYMQYQQAFNQAFADNGITPPPNAADEFFRSGQNTTDFTHHVETYANDRQSYDWQNGQAPDETTAIGLGDPTQGGILRQKLANALNAQTKYVASSYNTFAQGATPSGQITENI